MALNRGRGSNTTEAATDVVEAAVPPGVAVVVVVGELVRIFPLAVTTTRWKSAVSVFVTLVASAYSKGTS